MFLNYLGIFVEWENHVVVHVWANYDSNLIQF